MAGICLAAALQTASVAAQTSRATAAEASPAPPTSQVNDREIAAAHFAAAMQHYQAKRYREAIREFELSLSLVQTADVEWNLARAHERLGEDARAVERYRSYLRDRVDAPDAAAVKARIAELEQRIASSSAAAAHGASAGMLAIDVGQPGAWVLLDGRKLGLGPIDRVISVAPGRHQLQVGLPGHVPVLAEIDVQPGALSAARVTLDPLSRPGRASNAKLWTWITAGTATALFVTSASLAVVAMNARADEDLPSARRWALGADLALGAGLCAAIGAGVIYLSSGSGR